jgi:hypothetical protein
MLHTKTKNQSSKTLRVSITKEMAKPCVAKSARIAELNLDTKRTPGQSSTSVPGTVDKIIPSSRPSQPQKAHIALAEANDGQR